MNETRYPLCWPANWPRSKNPTYADFGKHVSYVDSTGTTRQGSRQKLTVAQGCERVNDSLGRMYVSEVVISTNIAVTNKGEPRSGQAEPRDSGVAVYWKRKGKPQCMAIDRYNRVADNLAAIAATLEALRAIERHGGGSILDRAFMGFAQLPASVIAQRPWRDVFGFKQDGAHVSLAEVESTFLKLAKTRHPDAGGEHDAMAELNAARASALEELK